MGLVSFGKIISIHAIQMRHDQILDLHITIRNAPVRSPSLSIGENVMRRLFEVNRGACRVSE